jgi:hypothetical protein
MPYNIHLLDHIRAIRECARRFSARVELDLATGHLEVRARGRRVELLPQFGFTKEDGSIGYSEKLIANVEFFVGWRAYFNRVWPLAFDKRNFKEFCRTHGVAMPKQWIRHDDVDCDVIRKQGVGSFSQGLRGPYTAAAIHALRPVLGPYEFIEQFILGKIAKIYYWNQTPVAVETMPMATVMGDGHRTLRQLINRIKLAHAPGDWDAWEQLAQYQSLTLDSVVAAGREVLVEYRTLSTLHPVTADNPNQNVLDSLTGTSVLRQLVECGEVFWKGIPEHIRQDTLYTVDAILDPEDKLWFLEMNCNPVVHPDAYLPMFESLFGATSTNLAPGAPPAKLKLAATG